MDEKTSGNNETGISYDKEKYDFQFILNNQLLKTTNALNGIYYDNMSKLSLKVAEQGLDTLNSLLFIYHERNPDYKDNRKAIKVELGKLNVKDRRDREKYNKLLLMYYEEIIGLFSSLNMLMQETASLDMA